MEEIRGEDSEDLAKIKVFSSDDEKLKILGELLSNKSSRDIIRSLIDKEMYANEIAKKLDLPRNLVVHHLRKMESIGLLEITNKKIIRKGEEHRFLRFHETC
jgi:predicted transcriptional regulator